MANFLYLALDAKGEQTTGNVQAESESDAIQQLRAMGLYPTQVVEEGKGTLATSGMKGKTRGKKKVKAGAAGKVKPKVLMLFTRQLATLIEAGLPLLRALTVLAKQEPDPAMRTILSILSDSVQSGATFSESLAQHPRVFNKLYVNMVKAGELGGVLEIVLTRLAEYAEKAAKLKSKITSAMVYPAIVMFIAVGILVFLLLVVVPKFKDMFADMELPMISQIVFGASENALARPFILPNVVWIFIVFGIFMMLFKAWAATKGGRFAVDKMKMKLPLLGDLNSKSSISRFCRTLGTLVTSGVPILQALTITRDTAGNVVVTKAVSDIHDAVKEGEPIVTPLQASGIFPDMVISMVDVGEETGQLPEMLLRIANVYDDEVDGAVTALTSILEPMMIVFLAVVVGGIVFALFLPLIKMVQSMD